MTNYKSQMIATRTQQGLSLVEFMVAIIVGSLLILGVVEIFVGNKQIYRSVDGLSRLQENGRFAIEILSHDIRMTGFAGCAGIASVTPRVIANPAPTGPGLASGRAAIGYDGTTDGAIDLDGDGSQDITVLPNTDVITITSAGTCSAQSTGILGARNADIQVTNATNCRWSTNDILMITDCQAMDVFRATNVNNGSSTITVAHAVSDNTDSRLAKKYQDNAVVYSYSDITYSIRNDTATGEPSLFQSINGAAAQPIIEGVEDMQIRYGVDNNGDSIADAYQTATAVGGPAGTNWGRVISVEINLLLRTMGQEGNNLTPQLQTYAYNGTNVTALDNRIRRVISKIIALRNKTL